MGPHGKREKISDPGGVRTSRELVVGNLILKGDKFAANEHVSEGETSKFWRLSTVKHIINKELGISGY